MKENRHVLAAVYADRARAKTILDTLERMHRAASITLVDAAIITGEANGKLKVHETAELTAGEGAVRGAVIAGIIGIIYPPSLIATAVTGGAIGALIGRLHDSGIKHDQLASLSAHVEPGDAMVVALVEANSLEATQTTLSGLDGRVVVPALTEAELTRLFETRARRGFNET